MTNDGKMKNRFYFQHDSGAMDDDRILDLRADLGWHGYGLFWGVLELLHRNDGVMKYDPKRVGFALQTAPVEIEKILNDYDLFTVEDGEFWSGRLLGQITHRSKLLEKRRAAGRKGGKAKASAKQVLSDGSSKTEPKERKVEESKGNESIQNEGDKGLPEMKEIIECFTSAVTSRGMDPRQVKIATYAKEFKGHYSSQGWRKGNGMPITDWRPLVFKWLTTALNQERSRPSQTNDNANHKNNRPWNSNS